MTNDGVKTIGGVELLSLDTLALLCGISESDAKAEYERQQQITPGRFSIPAPWRRGAKELQAKHGTNDFKQLIAHIRAEGEAQ